MKHAIHYVNQLLLYPVNSIKAIPVMFIDPLIDLFFADLRPLKTITVWAYLIAALAFFFQEYHSRDPDLDFLFRQMEAWQWTVAFLTVSVARLINLFTKVDSHIMRLLTPALGMWLWTMLLVSSAILTPAAVMSPLYLVCIAIEMWILSQYLTHRIDKLKEKEKCNLMP